MNYKEVATAARKKVLELIYKAGTSHIGSNFSVIDIATVLYNNLEDNERVVWSKGWAAATIYYFLAEQGKIPKEDLDKFPNAPYLGLAELGVQGVYVTAGSVGQGLPVATGMAYAKKLSNDVGRVFCIMSDGELDSGMVWESARVAARHKLNNLVGIIDQNGWQALGRTEEVNGGDPREIFAAFGWAVQEVDGHRFEDIEWAIQQRHTKRPMIIVAKTIKCKGISFLEDKLESHYLHITDEIYQKAIKELNAF